MVKMAWNRGGGSSNFAVIAKSDTVDIAGGPPEYIHVQQAGNLVVRNRAGDQITLAVEAGIHMISPRRVESTNTTCGQVVGFWADT